jgi:lysylphosphatidylglycerol synthetase-like protein (DUF2156 family)
MSFVPIETELTTAFTDLILAIICVIAIAILRKSDSFRLEKQRITVWITAFGCLTMAALLGFFAHGFEMSDGTKQLLWHPLYLCLGLTVSLFAAGVLIDLKGAPVNRVVIAGLMVAGLCFYAVTIVFPDNFIVFILYQAVAMLFALGAYLYLWRRYRKKEFVMMTTGIVVSMIAAGIQASGSISMTLIWEFDHNGLFHIVQMAGIYLLTIGVLPRRDHAGA